MSKYDVLGNFLKQQPTQLLLMNFSEVEKVLGFKLPASAHEYSAWWANEHTSHVQARAWMNAGFETEQVDLASKKLVFKRVQTTETQSPISSRTIGVAIGMSEEARDFRPANAGKKRVHPLIGWMKGTFTIEPGYDLTRPTMDDDELAEMEANLDRTADMIDQGMSKKR